MQSTEKALENLEEKNVIKEFNIQEITESNLTLMESQILEIPELPEDREQYKQVKDMNIQAKKLLPRIEERRKELKAPILKKGKLIDDTAKKAAGMVKPLIDMSGSRRSAWEAQKAVEKAKAEWLEAERMAHVENHMYDLKEACQAGLRYNLKATTIFDCLKILNQYEISAVDFEDRIEEAEQLLAKGIDDNTIALDNRIEFENQQAEAAKIKAEQEAEAKRLKEAQDKLDAKIKAAADEAQKKADEAAEKQRKIDKQNRLEREALEKEKAEIEAAKQAEIKRQYEIDYGTARFINFNMIHAKAIVENAAFDEAVRKEIEDLHVEAIADHEQFKADLQAEMDQARAEAKARWEATEKAKVEAAERAKLVGHDKKILSGMLTVIDTFISDFNPVDGEYKTNEAAKIELDLIVRIKSAIEEAEKAGEDLI